MYSRPVLVEVLLSDAFLLLEEDQEAEVRLRRWSATALDSRLQFAEGVVVFEVILERSVCLSRFEGGLFRSSDDGYGSQEEAYDRDEQHCESCRVAFLNSGLSDGKLLNL